MRVSLHDYIAGLYRQASEDGSPLIRTMFYEFPDDPACWELADQYLFGPTYLVAPILELDQFAREVYLPAGSWKLSSTGEVFEGPRTVSVDAPLDYLPVFERMA